MNHTERTAPCAHPSRPRPIEGRPLGGRHLDQRLLMGQTREAVQEQRQLFGRRYYGGRR